MAIQYKNTALNTETLIRHRLDRVLVSSLVVVVPGMLCNSRLLHYSSSGSGFVLFHPGLEGLLGFSYVDTATAAWDLVYDTGLDFFSSGS